MAKKPTKKQKRSYKAEDLKSHHSKAFRKRHLSLLILSVAIITFTLLSLYSIKLNNNNALRSAKDLITKFIDPENDKETSYQSDQVISSFGFSLLYDSFRLQASGLDSSTNSIYVGKELNESRPYSTIKISPSSNSNTTGLTGGYISLKYYQDNPLGVSADLAKLEAQYVSVDYPNFVLQGSSTEEIDGLDFLKSNWSLSDNEKHKQPLASDLSLISYTGLVNNSPFTVVVNSGLNSEDEVLSLFEEALDSLSFSAPSSLNIKIKTNDSAQIVTDRSSTLSLLDRLTFTKSTNAQSFLNENNPSERISLLYGPAVVKIYNFYCMDINLNSKIFIPRSCSATTGSGFLVSSDGYLATNGHVVVNDPLSIAITYAFEQINNGNSFYFSQLASASGLTQADLDFGSTNKDKLKIAIDKFYKIPTNRVTASNKSESILVGLGEQQPDLSKLLEATKLNQEYTLPLKTQKAELIGYNYREVDGAQTGVFTASDVALLKISGSNYPNVKLGDISSIVQGSNLNIIGYPGAASTNPLVEASQSIATLTSGKVSAIKTASGSDSKLIETDATIGHGNSGGPAFNDSGEVVGIATYTIDGSGEGDGVYNYIRDIADFKEVVYEKNISLAKSSSTQKTWEDAIELIYEAKYSKALIKLEEVRSLYPDHPKVDSLISYISQRPDQTEDVKDFPVLIASIATLVGILILTLAIILIINHGRRHSAYLEQSRVKNINEDKNGIQNIQV